MHMSIIIIHMSSSPKHEKGHSINKNGLLLPMPSSQIMFRKIPLNICIYPYRQIYIGMKSSFQKTQIFEFAIGIASSLFWIIAQRVLEKNSYYMHVYAHTNGNINGWANNQGGKTVIYLYINIRRLFRMDGIARMTQAVASTYVMLLAQHVARYA